MSGFVDFNGKIIFATDWPSFSCFLTFVGIPRAKFKLPMMNTGFIFTTD
jgi:hypothetical protein